MKETRELRDERGRLSRALSFSPRKTVLSVGKDQLFEGVNGDLRLRLHGGCRSFPWSVSRMFGQYLRHSGHFKWVSLFTFVSWTLIIEKVTRNCKYVNDLSSDLVVKLFGYMVGYMKRNKKIVYEYQRMLVQMEGTPIVGHFKYLIF